jgi:beta-glucosidase/6-phospho-beta-glucosidase/beta-galactosidase
MTEKRRAFLKTSALAASGAGLALASSRASPAEASLATGGAGPVTFPADFLLGVHVTADHYRLYREDLDLLTQLGVRSYRFSIGWPRVMPDGRIATPVDYLGLNYYYLPRAAHVYEHLAACRKAMDEGVHLRGYHNWSFLDDWEWGEYGRMGLVYVDYETQARTIKQSGYWYREGIRSGAFAPPWETRR